MLEENVIYNKKIKSGESCLTNTKDTYCFSLSIANILLKSGYKLLHIRTNHTDTSKLVFIFEPSAQSALDRILESQKAAF